MTTRIKESELILPSLYLIDRNDGNMTISRLIKGLRELLHPTGDDLLILEGRKDDRFSQKVRNLKSHNTLQRLGYVNYESKGRNTIFKINESGKEYLNSNIHIIEYLVSNNFSFDDVTKVFNKLEAKHNLNIIEELSPNEMISEGEKCSSTSSRYTRSKRLRDMALAHYRVDGKIFCHCCGFNFSEFYGTELGGEFIEMHHIRPICTYDKVDIEKSLKEAMDNIIPLCSNCHSMVHRRRGVETKIESIRQNIDKFGQFKAKVHI